MYCGWLATLHSSSWDKRVTTDPRPAWATKKILSSLGYKVTPIPVLRRQSQADLWVSCQPGLQNKFQDSQSCRETLSQKHTNKRLVIEHASIWEVEAGDQELGHLHFQIHNEFQASLNYKPGMVALVPALKEAGEPLSLWPAWSTYEILGPSK